MTAEHPNSPDHFSLVAIVNVLLRRRYLILSIALLSALVTGLRVARQSLTYTSVASFMSQSSRQSSNLSGIGSQFGINLGGADGGQSAPFYVDLLSSRTILEPVVQSRFDSIRGPDRGKNLIEIFRIGQGSQLERLSAAAQELRSAIGTAVSPRTGVVTLQITAASPSLAQQISARLIDEVNQFNLQKRKSQASAERRFTEERLSEVRMELNVAEGRLSDFLRRNRNYGGAPELVMEHDRLAREVDLRQKLQTTVAQAYEQAKVDEVRDTPVITIVERPDFPVQPNARGRIKKTVVAFMVGLVLGMLAAILVEYVSKAGERQTDQVAEFAELRRAALNDLMRPWSPVKRAVKRGRRGT